MTDNPGSTDYVPNIVVPDEEISTPALRLQTIAADIQNAINAGYSVEETIRGYRAAGLSFTDSNVRDLYHNTKGEIFADVNSGIPQTRNLPPDARIDDSLRQILSWKSNDRYADVIRLSVYDKERDESKEILFRYYHSNEDITTEELVQIAMETYNELDDPNAQYYVATSGSLATSYRSNSFI